MRLHDSQHHEEPDELVPPNSPPCLSWCESRSTCISCGYPLCNEHEPDAVVECPESGWHHNDEDCRRCTSCALQDRDDAISERGDAIRGGDVW